MLTPEEKQEQRELEAAGETGSTNERLDTLNRRETVDMSYSDLLDAAARHPGGKAQQELYRRQGLRG